MLIYLVQILFCLLKYIVAEAVISVIFEDDNDGKDYSIQWADLLGSDEVPIEEFSAIKPVMDIMFLLLYVKGMLVC